jgi:DNA-binding response OmpR family regulator
MDYSPWAQQACIMFVDGNADLRSWVKDFLEAESFKVLTARNSVEALVLAADYPFSIDVLIADAEMKIHQNGVELADCFRILRPETQVLLVGGRSAADALEWERLPKSFTRSGLITAVTRLTRSAWAKAA